MLWAAAKVASNSLLTAALATRFSTPPEDEVALGGAAEAAAGAEAAELAWLVAVAAELAGAAVALDDEKGPHPATATATSDTRTAVIPGTTPTARISTSDVDRRIRNAPVIRR
jgi:hypothetical protein